jgi:hypothetical protein
MTERQKAGTCFLIGFAFVCGFLSGKFIRADGAEWIPLVFAGLGTLIALMWVLAQAFDS